MWQRLQGEENNWLWKSEYFGGSLLKGFTAFANKITCQTVSSVDDSPVLIILPYFISCLEPTLTVLFWFLLSVNLWVMLLLECWVFRKTDILDEACLNTVTADNFLNYRGKELLILLKKEKYRSTCSLNLHFNNKASHLLYSLHFQLSPYRE